MKILIVDDEFVSRAKLQNALKTYATCHEAVNGSEALQAFETAHAEGEPYTLITVDINLPDIKGQELVAAIREWERQNKVYQRDQEVKILMISIQKDSKSIMKSFRKGCESYLSKPYEPKAIEDALVDLNILRRPRN